jgi:hypothetical protein
MISRSFAREPLCHGGESDCNQFRAKNMGSMFRMSNVQRWINRREDMSRAPTAHQSRPTAFEERDRRVGFDDRTGAGIGFPSARPLHDLRSAFCNRHHSRASRCHPTGTARTLAAASNVGDRTVPAQVTREYPHRETPRALTARGGSWRHQRSVSFTAPASLRRQLQLCPARLGNNERVYPILPGKGRRLPGGEILPHGRSQGN